MKDLEYYLLFAERMIKKFSQKYRIKIDISEDFISYVAHRIMKGDANFSMDKVKSKKRDLLSPKECKDLYLKQCAIYGIRAYFTSMKQKKEKESCLLFTDVFNDDNNRFSIDTYLNITKNDNPLERLCGEDDKSDIKSLLNIFISSSGLTDNEVNVIKQRFHEDKTFKEIAKENNVTVQAVNLTYQKALKKMSSMIKGV